MKTAYDIVYSVQCKTFAIARELAKDNRNVSTIDEVITPPFCLRIKPPYRNKYVQEFRNQVAKAARNQLRK